METPAQERFQWLRFVIFGMMASHFMYAAVGLAVVTRGRFDFSDMQPLADLGRNTGLLFYLLAGSAFVMLVLSGLLPSLLSGSGSSPGDPRVVKIIQHAMLEGVGIMGLIALFLTGWATALLFNLVAIVFHLIYFPFFIGGDESPRTGEGERAE